MTANEVPSIQRYTLVTILAALFNFAIILLICFRVMSKLETMIVETGENQKVLLENRALIEQNQAELREHYNTIKRLNELLDAAAARKAKEKP